MFWNSNELCFIVASLFYILCSGEILLAYDFVWVTIFFFFSLEERQRTEKRNREAKGHAFTPRWFDLSGDVTTTPWGELEVYQYNGRYTEHRAAIDASDVIDEGDTESIDFNPWQYGNLVTE